ncbi:MULTISPECIES: succinate dehydrogenase assembly factor 2 [Variovorax]|jgi:antitoxin CptB|uniref:FAD assembly factor SdhE n=1 Tax=Variovorax TaxID=34072 RepID=UPI001224404B|nr:succinate dehydrogenase assembly factor 2 [Variovorax sp.]TAJ64382.1 MAG: succinate dehydrogenase assembly factor 2 [Variovorax sp.]
MAALPGTPSPSAPPAGSAAAEPLGERALSKLKWRCRRGLLENDLFIARFFERHESRITVGQAGAMEVLMDLSDNDLLDLLLRRKEPEPAWAGAEVVELLQLMRADGAQRPATSTTSPSSPSRTIL